MTPEQVEKNRARSRRHYQRNKALYKQRALAWAEANPEKRKAILGANYERRVAYVAERCRQWRQKNPAVTREYCVRRRFRVRQAAPQVSRLERTVIRAMYDTALFLRGLTGRGFHVDHIVPLARGGAHRSFNLQVLTAVENQRKGARL